MSKRHRRPQLAVDFQVKEEDHAVAFGNCLPLASEFAWFHRYEYVLRWHQQLLQLLIAVARQPWNPAPTPPA